MNSSRPDAHFYSPLPVTVCQCGSELPITGGVQVWTTGGCQEGCVLGRMLEETMGDSTYPLGESWEDPEIQVLALDSAPVSGA